MPFRRFIAYAERHPNSCNSPSAVSAGLLEAIINRVADVIERVATDLDGASVEVFSASASRRKRGVMRDFRKVLERLGQNGELISKARESLVSLSRLLTFVQQSAGFEVFSRPVFVLSIRSKERSPRRELARVGGRRWDDAAVSAAFDARELARRRCPFGAARR